MPAIPADLAQTLAAERKRLVGLCAVLTGEPRVAEDLAQETLLEAWRHLDRLVDPSGLSPWLSAIARNVCLRWTRHQGRDSARVTESLDTAPAHVALTDLDLELHLERVELAQLLDRALALLPAETRAAFVARYLEDLPQAQVALRLGLSEGAVAMRLQRGKLALRRLLRTELRAEAAAYGLDPDDDEWTDTQLWCPVCGRQRLRGRLARATGEFVLRCPACNSIGDEHLSRAEMPLLHRTGRSPRAAAGRLRGWLQERYWTPSDGPLVRCTHCERLLPPALRPNSQWPHVPQVRYALVTECPACGTHNEMWLTSLAFGLPEGKAFWRAQPRMRVLPERDLTWNGHPAVLVGFESMTSAVRLEVLVIREPDGLRPLIPC